MGEATVGLPRIHEGRRTTGFSRPQYSQTNKQETSGNGRRREAITLATGGCGHFVTEMGKNRLNKEARKRFNELWNIMRKPAEIKHDGKESNFRISEKDAQLTKEAGIIGVASGHPTTGWVVPFRVVEEKPTGLRRRVVAWPKEKNERKDYGASVSSGHVSQWLGAVRDERAALFDLKASFFRVVLPDDVRAGFRCRTESRELVEFTRLPMGYKCSPEILHTIKRALAGDLEVVKPEFAAPSDLTIRMWIGNIRISGSGREVRRWARQINKNVRHCGATLGETQVCVREYDFIGVHFNHETNTACLSAKTTRRRSEASSLETLSVGEMESTVSRMMYAAGVRCELLFPHYFFLKEVRKRLSRLNRGLSCPQDGAGLPSAAVRVGDEWLKRLLQNEPVQPPVKAPSAATLATDASMQGWDVLLFNGLREIRAAGGAFVEEPHMISQSEARAAHLALEAFRGTYETPLHICVDNTTVMNIMAKGNTHSDALVNEVSAIDNVLRDQDIQATWRYVVSKNNPADDISRRRAITRGGITKGWCLRRGSREAA